MLWILLLSRAREWDENAAFNLDWCEHIPIDNSSLGFNMKTRGALRNIRRYWMIKKCMLRWFFLFCEETSQSMLARESFECVYTWQKCETCWERIYDMIHLKWLQTTLLTPYMSCKNWTLQEYYLLLPPETELKLSSLSFTNSVSPPKHLEVQQELCRPKSD